MLEEKDRKKREAAVKVERKEHRENMSRKELLRNIERNMNTAIINIPVVLFIFPS